MSSMLSTWVVPGMGGAGSGGMETLYVVLMFAGLIAVWYFIVIRPQKKQQEQHELMVSSLDKEDEVVTVGGLHGTVVGLGEETIQLKIADGTNVTVNRSSVASIKNDDGDDDE